MLTLLTVFPENVTVVPCFNLLRLSVVEDGTAKLERTIDVQDAVAEATCETVVTVQVPPVLLDPLVVVVFVDVAVVLVEVVVLVFVDVVVFVEVHDVLVEVDVDAADGTHCKANQYVYRRANRA